MGSFCRPKNIGHRCVPGAEWDHSCTSFPAPAKGQAAEQDLGERLLLAGGNLKEVAGALEVSYPTLRKRLDDLIAALRRLRDEDEKRCQVYLDAVESGAMTPEEAARLIKELKGAA